MLNRRDFYLVVFAAAFAGGLGAIALGSAHAALPAKQLGICIPRPPEHGHPLAWACGKEVRFFASEWKLVTLGKDTQRAFS